MINIIEESKREYAIGLPVLEIYNFNFGAKRDPKLNIRAPREAISSLKILVYIKSPKVLFKGVVEKVNIEAI